jgi:P-type Ca2+ transporter type 2C
LCNNATLNNEKDKKKALGDPIEIALLELVNTADAKAEALQNQYERIGEKPFNSIDKIMGTLHISPNGNLVAAKGAVENLLQKCTTIQVGESTKQLNDENRKTILATSEKMAAEGLRVLAFAFREEAEISQDDFLNNLVYLGMIGFIDPPRLDIKGAINMCKKAGIKIVMITGDHPLTALNIAKQTGLVEASETTFIVGKDLPPMVSLNQKWQKKYWKLQSLHALLPNKN